MSRFQPKSGKDLLVPEPGASKVMSLMAAAKHLQELGYPANASQLWRMCRAGKLEFSEFRKKFYVTHEQLMAALRPAPRLSAEHGVIVVRGARDGKTAGHRLAVAKMKQQGLMPSAERVAKASALARELERKSALARGDFTHESI